MRSFRLSGAVVITMLGVGAAAQRPLTDSHAGQPSGATGARALSTFQLTAATADVTGTAATWPTDLLTARAAAPGGHHLLPMTGDLRPVPELPPPPVVTVSAPPAPVVAASAPPAPAPVPVPAPAPAPVPTVTVASAGPAPASSATWQALRECESGDNYGEDTGNGYYGAYQFSPTTWHSLGYGGLPSQAPPATQDAAAQQLYDEVGWSAWPGCSAKLGLG